MTPTSCPHCETAIRQTRADGRCAVCGKLLPEVLRGPPSPAPWLGTDLRSIPIHDLGERASSRSAPSPGRTSPPTADERTPEAVAPRRGAEYAVPWPVPLRPDASFFSFWGSGDGVTRPFVLGGDAALRIAVEGGRLSLRVLCPDGSEVGHQSSTAGPGLALDSIPSGGTFALEVRSSARWGITVVIYPVAHPSGAMPPACNPSAPPLKRWWPFW